MLIKRQVLKLTKTHPYIVKNTVDILLLVVKLAAPHPFSLNILSKLTSTFFCTIAQCAYSLRRSEG